MKNIIFYLKTFIFFLVIKFSVYLNRHVFVKANPKALHTCTFLPETDLNSNEQTSASTNWFKSSTPSCNFPINRCKAVLLLQFVFVCAWFHVWGLCSHLFLIFIGDSEGRLCFVTLAFPGFMHSLNYCAFDIFQKVVFWHGVLHRSNKFANFCHDLMQNHSSYLLMHKNFYSSH